MFVCIYVDIIELSMFHFDYKNYHYTERKEKWDNIIIFGDVKAPKKACFHLTAFTTVGNFFSILFYLLLDFLDFKPY